MLEKASKLLKDGGYLIYCVCSIISSEGDEQIKAFLKNFKNFSLFNCFSPIESFGMVNNDLPYFLQPLTSQANREVLTDFLLLV